MRRIVCLILCICSLLVLCSCNEYEETEQKGTSDYEAYIYGEMDELEKKLQEEYRAQGYTVPQLKPPAYYRGSSSGNTPNQDSTVYVSKYGKIHKSSDCSGMKYYDTMTYSEARSEGYVRCQNCFGKK